MKYLLYLVLLLSASLAHAQLGPYGINSLARKHAPHVESVFNRPSQNKVTTVADSARWEILYRYRMLGDRLKPMIEDEMILLVGRDYTSYYSYRNEVSDSLLQADPIKYRRKSTKTMLQDSQPRFPEGVICLPYNIFNREYIYTHRFSGEMFCVDSDIYCGRSVEEDYNYCYREIIEKPQWEVSLGVDTLLHFFCQKATAHYGGREWTAWFAPSVPISEGPWKLRGLPGLILKAQSADGEFFFEAISLQLETKRPIEKYEESSCEKIEKNELFRHKKAIANDPFPYSYIGVAGSSEKKKYTTQYNPIEIINE